MSDHIEHGVKLLNEAADIRIGINAMYTEYKTLTTVMKDLYTDVSHKDIKVAVDAVHYFGGVGYPHPNSPGRMEELLDKMVGMFRVLELIGKGGMVERHLARQGVELTINKRYKLEDANLDKATKDRLAKTCQVLGIDLPDNIETRADLFKFGIKTLNKKQSDICHASNRIRKEIKPDLQKTVGMEVEEIKRGIASAKLRKSDRVGLARKSRKRSTESYKTFISVAKSIEGPVED